MRSRRRSRCSAFGAAPANSERRGQDQFVDDRGSRLPPILPREVAVPVAPLGVGRACSSRATRQREIADREHARPFARTRQMPAAIAERVELLDIAELQSGLLLHPVAQSRFQRAMRDRIERAEGQGVGALARAAPQARAGARPPPTRSQPRGRAARHAPRRRGRRYPRLASPREASWPQT